MGDRSEHTGDEGRDDGSEFEDGAFDLNRRAEDQGKSVLASGEFGEDGDIVDRADVLVPPIRPEGDRVTPDEVNFDGLFESAPDGMVIVDTYGEILMINAQAERMFGYRRQELQGHQVELLVPERLRANHPARRAEFTQDSRPRPMGGGLELYARRKDGSEFPADISISQIETDKGVLISCAVRDITDRRQMERELTHLVLHDSLTGLPNRALLVDRLVQNLASSRRRRSQLAVLFLDIDHFKVINDSMGHAAGDDLLRKSAERITGAIRPGDTVARFGGDEFVVFCDDVSVNVIEQIATRILAILSQPCQIGDQEVNIRASVGIAVAEDDATPESLLRDSETAMYRAKKGRRGSFEIFNETLRSNSELQLAASTAMHGALERGEFTVLYQPVIDLTTGTMTSAEALLRWEHPERGQISPVEFIPVAEETGLVVPIGMWVFEQACQQLIRWRAVNPDMTVAVNLSVRQMADPEITRKIESVMVQTGVKPQSVCLELTETIFVDDVDRTGATLKALNELGVQLAMDDFGTGYSSLSYFKRFPFDAVKVDQQFVGGLGTDPHDSALVSAIIAMASSLGLEVIAEGVETRDQLIRLQQLSCRHAQGFYLARPMPADEIFQLVAEHHRWAVG
jgi:diguanylate cyclase (GGDEF)-like protein/PAS domain S-box-containing protein